MELLGENTSRAILLPKISHDRHYFEHSMTYFDFNFWLNKDDKQF